MNVIKPMNLSKGSILMKLGPLPLPPILLAGLALCATLMLIPWVVQAQSQEVTPTADGTTARAVALHVPLESAVPGRPSLDVPLG